ncbi:hypothetical protein N7513_003453 [Penicillium frequentans]|uniref:Uncharacterized protein n=1 Tax=Penicillium frequentans TaxID=3151616 RepID=A0AAD6CXF4_9EURO|nr:hypothetical protein N7494_005072 [Penicillium glabrum]KAJ5557790.1 hypothetical protein N7513_003376 [Penicillium glabrum]KAJ5557867.1 hypothetical protein N7513_003453 [Penicillium glabrum]
MAVTDESRGLDETVCVAREDGRACRYLTRTEDLKSTSQSGVVLVGQVQLVLTISLALRTCGWTMDVMSF